MKSENQHKCYMPIHFLQRFWGILRELIIGLLGHLAAITLFVVTFPFSLYRGAVTYLARLYDDDITTCITGLSAVFLRDYDSYHKKSLHTSVACLKMKGKVVDVSILQKTFLERVVLKKKGDNPEQQQLAYPELQQCYTRFMGYMFFKWDRDFDIRNHIILHDNPKSTVNKEIIVTRRTLTEIWEHLMIKPYAKNRSPWEIVVVPNYVPDVGEVDPPDWFLFLRLHHGLADGLWFEKILAQLFATSYKPNFTTKLASSVSPTQRMLMHLRCLIFGPYDLVNRNFRFREDFHRLHLPYNRLSKSFYLVEGPYIPIESVKHIKNHYRVAFTSVLLEIIAGGVRRYMLRKGMKLPEIYSLGIPFPKFKQREDKMGNDFYLTVHDLPIRIPRAYDRLMSINNALLSMKNSSFMQMLDIVLGRISNFPSPILRAVTRKSLFSAAYSTLPGPSVGDGAEWFGDFEVIDGNFSHGMASDSLGLGFSTLTFLKNMRMTVFADKNVVEGRRDVHEILNCLMDEYNDLRRMVAMNC